MSHEGRHDDVLDDEQFDEEPLADPVPLQTDDGIPIRGYYHGEPVPDLRRLPRERWREALRPLRHGTAGSTVATEADFSAIASLNGKLLLEDGRSRAIGQAPPPRMPVADLTVRGVDRALYEERRAR